MEFGKKDLRTLDVVTYRNGQERTVYLGTPEGDKLYNKTDHDYIDFINFQEHLIHCSNSFFDVINVTRNGKTIFERTENLPYSAWYRLPDYAGDFMAFYISYNTAFGFDTSGNWIDLIDGWEPLNNTDFEPVPTEEWQARLIEYAKSKGYQNGNYECLFGSMLHNQKVNELVFRVKEDGNVWHGYKGYSNCIFQLQTGKWAEIIEADECDLSTEELIELLKKRTGADHVQISIDKK